MISRKIEEKDDGDDHNSIDEKSFFSSLKSPVYNDGDSHVSTPIRRMNMNRGDTGNLHKKTLTVPLDNFQYYNDKDFAKLFERELKNSGESRLSKAKRLSMNFFLRTKEGMPDIEEKKSFEENYSPEVSPITRVDSHEDLRGMKNIQKKSKSRKKIPDSPRRVLQQITSQSNLGAVSSDITPMSTPSAAAHSPKGERSFAITKATREDTTTMMKSSRSDGIGISQIDSPTFSNDAHTNRSTDSIGLDSFGPHRRIVSEMPLGGFRYTFEAPSSGKLGIIIESKPSKKSGPIIFTVKDYSPLFGMVQAGDKIVAVDGEDTSNMNTGQVTALLTEKHTDRNKRKTITITVMSLHEKHGFRPELEVISMLPQTPTPRGLELISPSVESTYAQQTRKTFSFDEKTVNQRQPESETEDEDGESGFHLLGAMASEEDDHDLFQDSFTQFFKSDQIM